MAAMNNKTIIILLFLALVSHCYSQCQLSDLRIEQKPTGVKVQGKQEWQVSITANCPCTFSNVILNCSGFQTVEPVDPSILRVQGQNGLLANGNAVSRSNPVTFRYARDTSFSFKLVNAQITCS
ncbi:hypothetical protein HN51_005042 [Arachis hypogaea]|uniref:Beta-1,3-N-Acetylglucosaminyltransferase family protein n=2 Tax=Arachis TaxID=3817 RepID=A0A445DGB8_ARAHY|nr:uncharacterized protein LOC127739603 [Arachis duranensis]XP_025692165.1 uncharacterized protein LOC112794310 [Arachis hypogaea]QHO38733.1 uncharacterized protein DS421_4g122930 [Arachis hypogaea]RYR62238.1 hypothetical protein Ahy_A04g019667 [Arachis hypogaea]